MTGEGFNDCHERKKQPKGCFEEIDVLPQHLPDKAAVSLDEQIALCRGNRNLSAGFFRC